MKQFLATFLAILAAAGIIFVIREIYFAKKQNDEFNSTLQAAAESRMDKAMIDATNSADSNPNP